MGKVTDRGLLPADDPVSTRSPLRRNVRYLDPMQPARDAYERHAREMARGPYPEDPES